MGVVKAIGVSNVINYIEIKPYNELLTHTIGFSNERNITRHHNHLRTITLSRINAKKYFYITLGFSIMQELPLCRYFLWLPLRME